MKEWRLGESEGRKFDRVVESDGEEEWPLLVRFLTVFIPEYE